MPSYYRLNGALSPTNDKVVIVVLLLFRNSREIVVVLQTWAGRHHSDTTVNSQHDQHAATRSPCFEFVAEEKSPRHASEVRQNGQLPVSENKFAHWIPGQKVYVQRSFTLESGVEMHNVPVAYMTWGTLSPRADNVIVVCHALSGSADVGDWWKPLLGAGQAFDTDQFFVICMNSLGSPYGTASPVTAKNGDPAEGWYGADFPSTTIRDDVRLHRSLLNELGVRRVAAVVGGSMGGMHALEWAYEGKGYVCCIVAIATCAYQGAWAIGWGETQRHAIYYDPKFHGGRYSLDDPPVGGLESARMAALLTYRSRDALEHRFSRQGYEGKEKGATAKHMHKTQPPKIATPSSSPTFVVQSYLRYQAKKFTHRFDSNCYLALTHKLDSHDVARGRADTIADALALIEQPTLVLGIKSDGLYTYADQEELARSIPNAALREIVSEDGHDAFLIESRQINDILKGFWNDHLRDII